MWVYEKKLQFPVKIKNPNPRTASLIVSQLGGPDGELAASMRYLNQRYSMPDGKIIGILTDVGTEELAHLEMIGSILHQLTANLSAEEIEKSPLAPYFTDHTTGVYPVSAAGVPTDMKYIGVKGDTIADLNEDLAAEQKARVTYDNLLRMIDDPDVREPLKFLREREIVHYQRFGEPILLFQTDFPCLTKLSGTGNFISTFSTDLTVQGDLRARYPRSKPNLLPHNRELFCFLIRKSFAKE